MRATDCLHSAIRAFTAFASSLAIAMLVAAPAASENDQHLKLTKTSDGLYAVETSVNGAETLPFVIDTAAAVSAIRSRLLDETDLEISDSDWRVFGLLEVDNAPMVQDAHLEVGPIAGASTMAVLTDEDALADYASAGLLGLDVLMSPSGGDRFVSLDFANQELSSGNSLWDVGVRRKSDWEKSSLEADLPKLITFEVSVGGIKGTAILDTGLQFAVVNSAYVDAMEKRPSNRRPVKVVDVHGEEEILRVLHAGELRMGELKWKNIRALVSDPPVFDALNLQNEPTMLLGANFIHDLKIVFDRKSERYVIDTPKALATRKACTGSRLACASDIKGYNSKGRG